MRLADIFESDMRDFFKQLQKTDPRFASLRVRGDAEHDALRQQDQAGMQARRDQDLAQGQAGAQAQIQQDRDRLPELQQQLAALQSEFDPNYQYSDDSSVFNRNQRIAAQINQLQKRIAAAKG